ncbi:MAG: tyrosine--tRNA ligase, partial [Treponemataceae bacterium]|nr:tyrosine--tRNA ligase [Treponemataceae bacterium]
EGSKENMPTFEYSRAELDAGKGAIDMFLEAGLGATKSDVRRLILQNGAAVNGKTFSDVKRVLSASDLDGDGELVLRAGKKKFVRVVFK